MARMTRARVEVLTTLALLRTRETVAVDTLARRATCSRFMSSSYCTLALVGGGGSAFRGEGGMLALEFIFADGFEEAGDDGLGCEAEEAVGIVLNELGDLRDAGEVLQAIVESGFGIGDALDEGVEVL